MRNKSLMTVAVLAVTVLAATGCGTIGTEPTSAPSNQPSTGTVTTDKGITTTSTGKTAARTLYFVDGNNRVVPMRVELPLTNEPMNEALQYMVAGGPETWLSGTGLHAPMPTGTKILGINPSGDLVKVSLSAESLTLKDAKQQQALINAVTWELTEFPNIKQVQIEFNGRILPTLSPSGIPTGGTLSRDSGINLEVAEDVVNPADSTKVTVYLDENSSGAHYLVPVTRILPQTADEDIVKETVSSLHEGAVGAGLQSPLSPSAELINESVEGKTATLDFSQSIYQKNQATEAVHALALSLKASAGIDQIKILVNGKVPMQTEGIDFSKVVTAPTYVNEIL